MKFLNLITSSILLVLGLAACTPAIKSGEEGVVEVRTAGIYDPIIIKASIDTDLGDFLKDTSPVVFNVTLTNNSSFDHTSISIAHSRIDLLLSCNVFWVSRKQQ